MTDHLALDAAHRVPLPRDAWYVGIASTQLMMKFPDQIA